MSSQEILSLVGRLEAACNKRRELTRQRGEMIDQFRRTGQRADPHAFNSVTNDLETLDMEIAGLRGALEAFKSLGGGA